jgi:hypothetical protein
MKRNELASTYLAQYDDTSVIITDVTDHEIGCIAFDLSDGSHWFSDDGGVYRVAESLTDCSIGWDDTHGWVTINEEGSAVRINWVD